MKEYAWFGQTMGTFYNIKIIHDPIDEELLTTIQDQINVALRRVNQQMSTYIPESEISQFNNKKDTSAFEASKELCSVVSEALQVYKMSEGAFDITVNPLVALWGFGNKSSKIKLPRDREIKNALKYIGCQNLSVLDSTHIKKHIPDLEIDLSAIAKGYGVDVVANILNKFQMNNYLVEIGGEVYASGVNINHEAWKIGIDRPKYRVMPGEDFEQIINISNVGVATSGDYRNFFEFEGKIYSHTIDPKTGRPVTHNLASATIIAPSCMQADALATAVMVMGVEKGIELLDSMENVEGLLIVRIDEEEFVEYLTSGFNKYIQ